jgi:hypothetical protein
MNPSFPKLRSSVFCAGPHIHATGPSACAPAAAPALARGSARRCWRGLLSNVGTLVLVVLFLLSGSGPAAAGYVPVPEAGLAPLPVDPPSAAGAATGRALAARAAFARLPLYFFENQGQLDEEVAYYARQGGASLYFTPGEMVMALPESVLRLRLVGANPRVRITGAEEQAARFSHFAGSDPDGWHSGIRSYGQVVYHDLYPGVDLRYVGRNGALKYEFVLQPGADPAAIRLSYAGVEEIRLTDDGDLLIVPEGADSAAPLRDAAPLVYQEIDGLGVPVAANFRLYDDHTYGFALGTYDPAYPLVIDPDLSYSTFLGGGNGDRAEAIALDGDGYVYVAGRTWSGDFPTTAGAYDQNSHGSGDLFVSVLDPTLSTLLYSTYLGGGDSELVFDLILDDAGQVYLMGLSNSGDFPTTVGAYDVGYNGSGDAFVSVLDSTLSTLAYSTFLGGGASDWAMAARLDGAGNVYVVGYTDSSTFPTTAAAYDRSHAGGHDAWVGVLNPTLSSLLYATFLGGAGDEVGGDLALDGAGKVYVAGRTASSDFPTTASAYDTGHNGGSDAFVSVLDLSLSSLSYSTFLGGSGDDMCYEMALGGEGSVLLVGDTPSADFPTTSGAYDTSPNGSSDVFVSMLDPTLSNLSYSTLLGGGVTDLAYGLALDSGGAAYVTGQTQSSDFPTTAGAYDTQYNGNLDAFVSVLSPTLSDLAFSTFLGGTEGDWGAAVALDPGGSIYLAGATYSDGFPVTAGAYDTSRDVSSSDAFVCVLGPSCPHPLVGVSILAPAPGGINDLLTFTAVPEPAEATTPITYTWSTGGLVYGQGTAQATYAWGSGGDKLVQVTARNCGGQDFGDSYTMTIRPAVTTLPPIANDDGDGSYLVDWFDVAGATSYTLEEDDNDGFSSPDTRYSGANSQYPIVGQPLGTWYYRVRASNAAGDGGWSQVRSATVEPQALSVYLPLVLRSFFVDPYEPNDGFAEAWGPLVSGQDYRAYFPTEADEDDYYYFDLPAAHSVDIRLSGILPGNDHALYLYDAAHALVDFSDEYDDADEHIYQASLPPGRYYVRVERFQGTTRTQPYVLRATFSE